MINRHAITVAKRFLQGFPALVITGPRQAGKTTLSRMLFPDKPYLSLENPDTRLLAESDPKAFLRRVENGAVLDEIQRFPPLFSYLQEMLDERRDMGRFILTGSQQFGLLSKVTQSLAGRTGLIHLLPFAYDEIYAQPQTIESVIFSGLYPPVHDRKLFPSDWYGNYIQTYVERDVRQLLNVRDLRAFQTFVRLCAGRSGQLLNLSQLADDASLTHNTAKAWLSLLEASYLVFLLPPHHRNFSKRLIKTPKLYFYDTGLACWLLGIQKAEQLGTHPLRGALFETFVISELLKTKFNQGLASNLYFWRDREGHEVDVVADVAGRLVPIEIKSGSTLNQDWFKGLDYFLGLEKSQPEKAFLIYGGNETHQRRTTGVLSWANLVALKNELG